MMQNNELESWIKLWRVSGIGPKKYELLLEYFDKPDVVFTSNSSQIIQAGLSTKDANAILDQKENNESYQSDLDWLDASDQHHILTIHCEEYPQRLKQISDPPALLYVHGNLAILNDPQIGIVGSRNPTQSGNNNAYEFGKHLAQTGLCVTSGLALGVDGAAHQGALDGNGPTIAVIATGIDRVYPAKHRELAHKIAEGGVIISEFPLETHPDARHFPRRNRIISAMSYGVLVVEAALKSGSLITARLAMEQNREVFAIPGSIHNPLAKGCHQLIRQGAKLVETAEDILEEMANVIDLDNHQSLDKSHAVSVKHDENIMAEKIESDSSSNSSLDAEQQALLNKMGYDPISIDQLVVLTEFDAATIASILLMLELQNIVAANGGGKYTRIK